MKTASKTIFQSSREEAGEKYQMKKYNLMALVGLSLNSGQSEKKAERGIQM